MNKGEVLQLLVASPADQIGDNLLELAAAYWLEKGNTPEDIIDMMTLVLDGSAGEDEPNDDDAV